MKIISYKLNFFDTFSSPNYAYETFSFFIFYFFRKGKIAGDIFCRAVVRANFLYIVCKDCQNTGKYIQDVGSGKY